MTRPKSVALAFLLGALLVGGLLGFTADRLLLREQICEKWWDQRRLRTRLAEDLSLTETQRVAVDSILDLRNRRINEVVAPVRPQMDSLMGEARDEIRTLLTPAQRTKFEEKIRESDARARTDTRTTPARDH